MISAKEARALCSDRVKDHLDYLNKAITVAATAKQTSVIIRESPYGYWLYDSTLNPEAKEVLETLNSLDFVTSLHYEEHQFVNVGLRISW